MVLDTIQALALQGKELNEEISRKKKQLEKIKTQMRSHASQNLEGDSNFEFLDQKGVKSATVRFPPPSVVVDSNHVGQIIATIGIEEFDRCFTLVTDVKVDMSALRELSEEDSKKLAPFIFLKENTPRVSFK